MGFLEAVSRPDGVKRGGGTVDGAVVERTGVENVAALCPR